MLLKNKVVLVTGSTSGIGAAIARCCLNQGAKVMLHGLEEEFNPEFHKDYDTKTIKYVSANLLETNSYPRIVQETLKAFGALDGLETMQEYIHAIRLTIHLQNYLMKLCKSMLKLLC